jgi:tRNA1Val (adenine37-N6)-methyltransferase
MEKNFHTSRKEISEETEETLDTLFRGELVVIQKRKGYRFSLDALLLAHFASVRAEEKIIDLGTGNGVIPLILSHLHPSVNIVGLEIQKEMAQRALGSVKLNRLGGKINILQGDVRSIEQAFSPKGFDTAICNPPYRQRASGRMNPHPEKRVARHEVEGELNDFLRAGFYLLRHKGKMALVYPATRTADLLETMRQEGLEPKRLRFVHSFEGTDAALVLVEGIKGARRGIKVLPPLFICSRPNHYTPELKVILGQ